MHSNTLKKTESNSNQPIHTLELMELVHTLLVQQFSKTPDTSMSHKTTQLNYKKLPLLVQFQLPLKPIP